MSEIMTMTEIANAYPNEWLLIADAELDDDLNILSGEVVAHSPDRDEVYQKLLSLKGRSFAIEYIGDAPEEWAVALLGKPINYPDSVTYYGRERPSAVATDRSAGFVC